MGEHNVFSLMDWIQLMLGMVLLIELEVLLPPGRLEELLFMPLPDNLVILKGNLHKSPVVKNVILETLYKLK